MKLLNIVTYTMTAIFFLQLAMYPIAAITGWQYSMNWGFTMWRETSNGSK